MFRGERHLLKVNLFMPGTILVFTGSVKNGFSLDGQGSLVLDRTLDGSHRIGYGSHIGLDFMLLMVGYNCSTIPGTL